MAKTQYLSARIDPELLADFESAIADLPGDRSDHVRQAVLEYIDRLQYRANHAALSPQHENGNDAS